MAHRGPVITAVVVLGGLVGFMTANAAGGLVVANKQQPAPAAETAPSTPPPSSEPPPSSTSEAPPPPPALPPEAVYAGKATGTKLAIAVAVKGEEAAGYLCDGRVESWLRGTATGGQVDLTSKDGSSSLLADFDGTNLAGTVTLAGQQLPFTLNVAAPPAGLYRGSDGATTVGWIILPDGSQVGVATTDGVSATAPALEPGADSAMVDGRPVPAEKVTGDTTFGVSR